MATKVKALQAWCQQHAKGYNNVKITNMTSSWKDGLAFCALIHRFRPDLIDYDSLSKENVLYNNKLAFKVAEEELGIAALLDAEDMVSMKVPDKLSIITYVSQYYNALHTLEPSDNLPKKRFASPTTEQFQPKRKSIESAQPLEKSQLRSNEKPQSFSICDICKKKVHLVERFIDGGKVYHRHCHRSQSLSKMYRREGSAAMHNYMEDVKSPEPKKVSANGHFSVPASPTPFATGADKSPSGKNATAKPYSSRPVDDKTAAASDASSADKKRSSKEFHVTDLVRKFSDGSSKEAYRHTWIPRSKPSSKSNSGAERNAEEKGDSKTNLPEASAPEPRGTGSEEHETAFKAQSWPKKSLQVDRVAAANVEATDFVQTNNTAAEVAVAPQVTDELVHARLSEQSGEEDVPVAAPLRKQDHGGKEMLPVLLRSLAEAKQRKTEGSNVDTNTDVSPTSATAPLISELPKTTTDPSPKPRSQTKSSDSPAPRAKPRSQPTLPQPSAPASTQEYNDELNSFGSPDSEASLTPEPRKDLSNPFDECDTASEENEPENPFGDEEETTAPESTYTNPFGDEEETEKPPTDRRQTVNIVSPNETRLNPFTDEYEKKKLSKPVKAGETPPKPPSRKKNAAPPPPASPSKSPAHGGAPRVKPPQPGSPQRRHKKPAPTWKDDVERKMEEVNAANKSDQRFVEKTEKPVAPQQTASKSPAFKSPARNDQKSPVNRGQRKPNRPPAPGFGFPLVKRKVTSQMTEEEITTEMKVLDLQLKDLEKKGVKLEEVLREDMELGNDLKPEGEQLLGEWFELVRQKNKLVRRETDLVFLMRQQKLEQEHADVEFKIRKLLNKPESEKSEAEKEEEAELLQQLMEIVERRNVIINSIEEERVKEEEEDAAYDMMKKLQQDCPNDSDGTKKKKKNKVKKMFSKRKKDGKPKVVAKQPDAPPDK